MVPTAAEECLGQFQAYAVRDFATALEVGVEAAGKGMFDDVAAIDNDPFGTGAAALGNDVHSCSIY